MAFHAPEAGRQFGGFGRDVGHGGGRGRASDGGRRVRSLVFASAGRVFVRILPERGACLGFHPIFVTFIAVVLLRRVALDLRRRAFPAVDGRGQHALPAQFLVV